MSDVLIVGRAFHVKHEFERMSADGRLYLLRADGSVTHHNASKVDLEVIYLEGSDDHVASWLDQARDRHQELSRATGWHLIMQTGHEPGRSDATYAAVYWVNEAESYARQQAAIVPDGIEPPISFIGPLPTLGFLIKSWRERDRQAPKDRLWMVAILHRLSEDMKMAIDSDLFNEMLAEHSKEDNG